MWYHITIIYNIDYYPAAEHKANTDGSRPCRVEVAAFTTVSLLMLNSQCHWSATRLVTPLQQTSGFQWTCAVRITLCAKCCMKIIKYCGDFQASWTLEAQVADVMNSQTPSDALAESVRACVSSIHICNKLYNLSCAQVMVKQHDKTFLRVRLGIPPRIPIQDTKIMKGFCSAEKFTYLTSGVAMTPECRARIHSSCFNDRQKTTQNHMCNCNHTSTLEASSTYSTGLDKHRQANRWLPPKWAKYAN